MFKSLKIRGGVHADERKAQSTEQPIGKPGIPPRLDLPLRQHAGKPAEPVVKAGQQVLKGELIAASGEDVCAALHAPTSGRVIAIEPIEAPHPSSLTTLAIRIETDGLDRAVERDSLAPDPMTLAPMAIADQVDQAGIVGLGGATFPAALKLKAGSRQRIHTLILNGSECEPYLTCDDMLMREQARGIIAGARADPARRGGRTHCCRHRKQQARGHSRHADGRGPLHRCADSADSHPLPHGLRQAADSGDYRAGGPRRWSQLRPGGTGTQCGHRLWPSIKPCTNSSR